jgi:glycerophosphoryl diester phosphodiesterase
MSIKTYAHRGFSGLYPENTMLAFQSAIVKGQADGIELDVHLSKDNELVVIHDEKVDRTTNGTGFVKDFDVDELKALNANIRFIDIYGKQEIPTFEEYCTYIKDKDIITNIEIKTNLIYYPNIEEKVVAMLKKFNLLDRVIISSFNHGSTIITKQIDKNIPCALLVDSQGLLNIGSYANTLNMEYYHPDVITLNKKIIEECKHHNIQVNTWTVNSMEALARCVELGVAGIITNYPDIVKSYIKFKGC